MPDQKPMWTRCLGGFSVMWVTKLLISEVKKRIFRPKTTKFGPKLAILVNLDQAMQAYSVPCWLVSWWLWRAGCISQDTYLLYGINIQCSKIHNRLYLKRNMSYFNIAACKCKPCLRILRKKVGCATNIDPGGSFILKIYIMTYDWYSDRVFY